MAKLSSQMMMFFQMKRMKTSQLLIPYSVLNFSVPKMHQVRSVISTMKAKSSSRRTLFWKILKLGTT